MLKKYPRMLNWLLRGHPKVAASQFIPKIVPIGSGTRGLVYSTANPNMVVKVTQDEREPIVAARIQKLNLKHVVQVYGTVVRKIDDERVIFTYIERMEPISGRRLAAQKHLHDNYKFSYHRPKQVLRALKEAIDGGKAPAKYVPHLSEFRSLIYEILDAGEWHRDLKAPNLMLDKNGTLKITDIGSFTAAPLVVSRYPLVTRQDLGDLIKPLHTAGFIKEADDIRKLAIEGFEGVDPLGGLGVPDPFHNKGRDKAILVSTEEDDDISEDWLPDEMEHVPRPDGGKWRNPQYGRDRGSRIPYITYDIKMERWRMNEDSRVRHPYLQSPRGN